MNFLDETMALVQGLTPFFSSVIGAKVDTVEARIILWYHNDTNRYVATVYAYENNEEHFVAETIANTSTLTVVALHDALRQYCKDNGNENAWTDALDEIQSHYVWKNN